MNQKKASLSSRAYLYLAGFLLIIVAGCILVSYFVWRAIYPPQAAATQAPVVQQPTQAPTNPPDLSTVAPVIKATQVTGGATLATPTTFQPSEEWPPENDVRPELVCAFNSFGSYFTCVQMLGMDNPARPYKLVLKPYNFETSSGEILNPAEEIDQANQLISGEVDILLNTPDILVNNPTGAKIAAEIDRSDGADITAIWENGKTVNCQKPIKIFNDLKGCVIAVARQSVGKFQALSFMKYTALSESDITLVDYPTVEEAVAAFNREEADGVAAWTGPDAIDSALEAGGKEILNSSWLGTIRDDIIVSANANENKEDLVFAFLVDWFTALKMQQESPAEAYELIATWKYGEHITNDWTGVYEGSAYDDMIFWMEDQIAQADLPNNLILFDNPQAVYDRLINQREVWAWGGQPQYEPFVVTDLVEPKYMLLLKQYLQEHPELLPTSGELIDTDYSPFTQSGTAPSADQLVALPTVAEFGCAQFNFSAGETVLDPSTDGYSAFLRCASSLKQLALYSDVDFLITGSAARPTFYSDERSSQFAKRRAMAIYNALREAGVPKDRIAVQWVIGKPTDDVELQKADRWVKIEIKRPAG